MIKLYALLGIAALSLTARAAMAEGENLLVNGSFDAEQVAFPEFWSPSSSLKGVAYLRTGGPEGRKPAIVLQGEGSKAGQVSVRQQGMTLVAGETYKLSAYIKTKGFLSRNAGLIIHNGGWFNEVGFKNLPADSEWKLHEKTFKLFASRDKEYGLAMFALDLTGEIAFADLKLEAVSEGARKGSSTQMSIVAAPRLVPFQPLLNRIPRTQPELTFKFYGVLPEKQDAYECLVTLDGDRLPPQTIPLKDGKVSAKLAGLPCGDYALKATVRHSKTHATALEASYPISIIEVPAIDRSRIQQLNNLVAEVLNEPVGSAQQTFSFVVPRNGWVFIAYSNAAPAPELTIKLDDRDTVITATTDRLEAFRAVSMGEHRLTISGNATAARLLVRSIPEIFDYPPCSDSAVKENGHYNWNFMKQHILPAATTLNGGALPGDALTEAKARGLKWLANFNVAPLTQPQYDGFTSDELFFGRATIDNYTKALWRVRNPEQRLIYSWIVGKPSIAALHTDFMSAALNASRGRGRLLFEAYCHPQPDEKAAAAYLDDMLGETMRRFSATFPGAAAGTGIIFGNFNQIPIISLEFNPAVDFKYFLDMQVNLVANSPDFANLATTGYWGTYYGDEELARWSFLLMRHYAVEGRKDMLSARYGFTYNPGFLKNPDFAEGLDGWTINGAIRADTLAGYGKNSQGRWGGGKAGDSVCVLKRQAEKPNRISQTAHGLTVGKTYCLQFVTADRKDVIGKKHNPRRYGIAAELEGAEIIGEKSFVHVDKRDGKHEKKNDNVGKINLHRMIFRAKSPTLVIRQPRRGTPPQLRPAQALSGVIGAVWFPRLGKLSAVLSKPRKIFGEFFQPSPRDGQLGCQSLEKAASRGSNPWKNRHGGREVRAHPVI
ncbi:MAG: hypothetical protein NTY53_18115 [Kiritimatiellaeota bacterium]|nr:hypothetical protein [Kiritimatiellota bacterium]